MSMDLVVVVAVLLAAIALLAGVLIAGDFRDQPCHRELDPRRREPRLR